VGDVVVTPDNKLIVGVNQLGSRTVESVADGPYSEIVVGQHDGASGELALRDGASLGTSGTLTVGQGLSAALSSLIVTGASMLSTNEAVLSSGPHRSFGRVSGAGSQWVNQGTFFLIPDGLQTNTTLEVDSGGMLFVH